MKRPVDRRPHRRTHFNPEGCAVVEQRIQGGSHDPAIDEPNVLVTLTAPFVDLLERGVALLTESSCDPLYTGRIAPRDTPDAGCAP
ncbi:hypothetical protein [Thioalkalivibrio thiocyanodenitrificans]|uniref:hypothetical protein n=1 Tax=Thioalkalivibrio thiocyanodenitrificans TaxID=243063 RepID=UPI00037C5ADC|nr:hypothetical protein [Thioalkalivibrio thiocyanodenitrificans]